LKRQSKMSLKGFALDSSCFINTDEHM
jgi:hypothetical protein